MWHTKCNSSRMQSCKKDSQVAGMVSFLQKERFLGDWFKDVDVFQHFAIGQRSLPLYEKLRFCTTPCPAFVLKCSPMNFF